MLKTSLPNSVCISIFTLLFSLSFSICAESEFIPPGSIEKYTCNDELWDEVLENAERRTEIMAEARPILEEIKAISNKAKDKDQPIGNQISRADSDKFSRRAVELDYLLMLASIEDTRENGLKAASSILLATDTLYNLELEYVGKNNSLVGFDEFLKEQNIHDELKEQMIMLWETKTTWPKY